MKKILICLSALALVLGVYASDAAPARATVLALVEQQMRSWETGDETAFRSTLHDQIVFAYPGKRLDQEGVLKIFRDWKTDFRETKLRIAALVIEGHRFSVEYMFSSTNRTTGVQMAVGTVATGEVRDGRLLIWKEYLDGRVSRLQAKGELLIDEAADPFPWPDTPESRKP